MDIVFLDLETLGTDPQKDAIVEIGLVQVAENHGTKQKWWIRPTDEELAAADPGALRINNFYARAVIEDGDQARTDYVFPNHRVYLASKLAAITNKCILAGINVQFDYAFLSHWMHKYGNPPAWDYHILDVPTYAAGIINTHHMYKQDQGPLRPPFRAGTISDILNVKRPSEEHTALGDAEWSYNIWRAVNDEGATLL